MFSKKLIAVFLCFTVVFTLPFTTFADDTGAIARAANGNTVQINGINRPVQAADEMLLFTRENAAQTTDTNPWCAAAIVGYQNGKYIITGIKDREGAVGIPYNGFVLFGHGVNEQWILDNLIVGDELVIEGYTLPTVEEGSSIALENGTQHSIDGVDQDRQADKLMIFTVNYGQYTGAFAPVDAEEVIVVNNIVIEKNTDGSTGTYIPSNGYVLSGTGTAKDFVQALQIGDKITLSNITIPYLPDKYFKVNGIMVPIDQMNAPRGANQVILYDSSYGASTLANPWGMEITVVGGIVTNVVGIRADNSGTFLDNNSPVPANGCVLSIHSESAYFASLNGQVNVGDAVDIVSNNIYVYNAGKISYDALNPKSIEDNPAGWDESKNEPYPGYRGADQLIVYDSAYGTSTGTNAWGYEVVVNSDNKIIQAGGNNSVIPAGGYVLSGHGVKADWLRAYAYAGSSVILNTGGKTVSVRFTPASFIDRAGFRIQTARDELAASGNKYLDVPYTTIQGYISSAEALVADASNKLAARDYPGMFAIISNIEGFIDKAHYTNYESRKVENRAVWIRPKETDLQQVSEHLDSLKALNINTIYLETWWGGYTIFPTDNTITAQNPMYNGFDVLRAYLDEAHKRGMEVHSWVENFFIGDSGTYSGGPVYAQKPEWLLLSRNGDNFQYVSMYDINYYFANPALPEVRDFITGIYKELVEKYDIDGMQLDYVRYPEGEGDNDFGYDTYTRGLFSDTYGVDPVNIFKGDALWDKWCDFRANIINTFVYRAVTEIRALKPDINISADVWPNYEEGPAAMMQEPKKWVAGGYIDNILPMSYTPDISSTVSDTLNTIAFAKGHSYVTTGLGTCMGLSRETLIGQVGAANQSGADGTALFEFESLMSVGYGNELLEGLYRNPAIIGDNNPMLSVNIIFADILRKIKDIYLPDNDLNRGIFDNIKLKLNTALNMGRGLSGARLNPVKAVRMNKLIEELMGFISESSEINVEIKNRILADLGSCSNILTNYIAHESFAENHPVDHISLEMPVNGLKVGDMVKIRVKATFADGEDIIMYLDPSQYGIKSSNSKVAEVQGDSILIRSVGNASIIIKISKDFIYEVKHAGRTITQKIDVVN